MDSNLRVWAPQESKMDPRPDYGRDSYRGSGKLTDMVRSHASSKPLCGLASLH